MTPLKTFIIQTEATKKQTTRNHPIMKISAPSASYARPKSKDRCYDCGDYGHVKKECLNKGKWKCYECQMFTDEHIADQCPLRIAKKLKEQYSRGSYRGRFRGRNRGNRFHKNENNDQKNSSYNNNRYFKEENRGRFRNRGQNHQTNRQNSNDNTQQTNDSQTNQRQFNNKRGGYQQSHTGSSSTPRVNLIELKPKRWTR